MGRVAVLGNLVKDVDRCYRTDRCALAAVLVSPSFTGPVMLASVLSKYYSD